MTNQIEQWSFIFCVIIPSLSYLMLAALMWAEENARSAAAQHVYIFCSRPHHRANCTCECGGAFTRAQAGKWANSLPDMDRGGWVSSRHGLYNFIKEGA